MKSRGKMLRVVVTIGLVCRKKLVFSPILNDRPLYLFLCKTLSTLAPEVQTRYIVYENPYLFLCKILSTLAQ